MNSLPNNKKHIHEIVSTSVNGHLIYKEMLHNLSVVEQLIHTPETGILSQLITQLETTYTEKEELPLCLNIIKKIAFLQLLNDFSPYTSERFSKKRQHVANELKQLISSFILTQ
jgi:hypothetical protein